ncbi:MAG TPA: asparagine synthase (glutamine-hydrolyzing), partial [Polyangiaceae bacterium]|nr:asparagine synthase (glutamine-hydrolyzing) [Polyangiaceae bacterium]
MCGIAGMLVRDGSPAAVGDLCRMAGALEHRGPDEFGVYRDAHVGLAHARLSIIDLSTGQQPMANEDDSLWVVFNGEIFNYVELREELEQRGHRFRTKSDTEVIVHAFEEWGSEAFARFNGQFAIALWDEQRRILTLARDRVGVRPLYICEHAGKVYFASEVKAIFAADRTIPRALDPIGLDETFTFWSVVPPQSVFRGIEELRPGHVRSYGPEGMREHAYWEASFEVSFRGSIEDATAEVRRALEEATRLRMLRADVRVGSYLSGGLDSSLVAALGLRAKGDKFRTFSLRFADAEYDETMYQREMSAFLGSDHAEVMVTRRDIAEVFPAVISHTERPILRTAPAPMFLLSRLVRSEGIKVVLTGEGADEMFAGYDIFREAKVRRFWAKEPASKSRPRLLERLYPYLARSPVAQRAMAQQFFGRGLDRAAEPGFAHDTRWRGAAALKRLLAPSDSMDTVGRFLGTLPAAFEGWSALARDQYIEIR